LDFDYFLDLYFFHLNFIYLNYFNFVIVVDTVAVAFETNIVAVVLVVASLGDVVVIVVATELLELEMLRMYVFGVQDEIFDS
jgi:hypothetical protein